MAPKTVRFTDAGSTSKSARIALTLALVGSYSTTAMAQELQEIVVTAQKREQSLQDVGVSVTAVTAEDLHASGMDNTAQFAQQIPAVQLLSATGANYGAQLTIRGVAQSDFSPHQESPNSMYIDDVYLSTPNAQAGKLFDVNRIEALRGPQGTLFGRNSTGGLVNIITQKPTRDTQGYIEVGGGQWGERRIEGVISGSLSEKVRGRLSAALDRNDGYVKNFSPGSPNTNTTDFQGVRAQLAADLTENLTALFSLTVTHDDDEEGVYGHFSSYYDPNNFGRPTPLPADIDAWGTGPGNDLTGYRSPYDGPEGIFPYIGFLRRTLTLPTIRLDWKLGSVQLTSISNFTNFHFDYDESCAGSTINDVCHDPYGQDLKQYSEELRLSGESDRLTWVTGLYGLVIHQHARGEFSEPYYAGTAFAFNSFNLINQKLNDIAIFGQSEYQFTSKWRGTLGLRLTRDKKQFTSRAYIREAGDFVSTNTVYNPPLLVYDFSRATVGDLSEQTDTNWSGKVQLDYVPNEQLLIYGSVSRGIKGAGFNGNLAGSTSIEETPFRGEKVNAYELGEKLTLFNNRLRVNGSIFYYDYRDFQTFQLGPQNNPRVSNNDAQFKGAELELAWQPVNSLETRVSVSHIDSTVYDVRTAQIGVVNQEAADAPKWSGNALIRYSGQIGPGIWAIQWSADYVGPRFHSTDNAPAYLVHSSTGHNFRTSYSLNNWEAALSVTNATDSIRETLSYDSTAIAGYIVRTYQPPRWWRATLRYSF